MTNAVINLTNISNTETKNDLISILRGFDITVPCRTKGRKTHHTERWTICRLLSTVAANERLSYPVSFTHRDRPDFLLQCHEAKIGIEVTEAISEEYASCIALAKRQFPDAILELGHFRLDSPSLSTEEKRELLRQRRLTSRPWAGDRPEREWALYIQRVIEDKLLKLAKPGFEKFPENWLAIYDNLALPQIHLEKAIGFLLPELERMWTSIPGFHAIYIEHESVVVKLSPNETTYMALHDLW